MKEYALFAFQFLDELAPTMHFIKNFSDLAKAKEAAKKDHLHTNFMIGEKDIVSGKITPFEPYSK